MRVFSWSPVTRRNGDNLNDYNCSQLIVDRQRDVKMATTWTATTAAISATDWAKMAKKQLVSQNSDNQLEQIWFRNYYVAHAFVVCNDYYSLSDVFEIYDNNILPRLIMIIISIIIIYFKHITHNDDFPLNGYPASAI